MPACSGGRGAAGTALAPAPPHHRHAEQQQHIFQCHLPPRTVAPAAPQPHFRLQGGTWPTGRRCTGTPGLLGEGGRSGWRDPQHGRPSPGTCTAPGGPGVWHSPRAAGGCGVPRRRRSCPAGRSPGHRPASAAPAEGRQRGPGEPGGAGQRAAATAAASTYQEGAEHGDGGEEVPDVVVVEEVEQDAVTVVLPRLGRRFLAGTGPAITAPARGHPACPSEPRRAAPPSPARC